MPMLVDHERRRAELVEAVWRVVRRDGVRGASVRGVAREAGLSVGSVRYFFATQDDLLTFAMREVVERVRTRAASEAGVRKALTNAGEPGEAALELLKQVLPLNSEHTTEMRVWFAFITYDAADPVVSGIRQEMDREVHQLCWRCVHDLDKKGVLGHGRDADGEARLLWALVDGMTLRIYLDPESMPPELAVETLRTHLHQLTAPAP